MSDTRSKIQPLSRLSLMAALWGCYSAVDAPTSTRSESPDIVIRNDSEGRMQHKDRIDTEPDGDTGQCNPGWQGDGGSCRDINECTNGSNVQSGNTTICFGGDDSCQSM